MNEGTRIMTEIKPEIKTEIKPGIRTEIKSGIRTEIDKFGKRVTLLATAVVGAACIMSSMSVTAKATEGDTQNVSLGQAVPETKTDATEEQSSQEEQKPVKEAQNNKLDFGSWSIKSTLEGNYYAEGVPGIAMLDYEYTIRQEANMSPVEYFFVTTWDITQDTAPLAVNTFRIVAQSQNALLGPVVQININKTISGKLYSLEGNPAHVKTMIGIPEDFREAGARFAVVCVKSGGVFEILPDTDIYDSTVTFSAKVGDAAYALIRYSGTF